MAIGQNMDLRAHHHAVGDHEQDRHRRAQRRELQPLRRHEASSCRRDPGDQPKRHRGVPKTPQLMDGFRNLVLLPLPHDRVVVGGQDRW